MSTYSAVPLLGLELEPTPAMLKGEQSVWQHSYCGTVVVLSGLAERSTPGGCPGCVVAGSWWRQTLPLAGLSVGAEREQMLERVRELHEEWGWVDLEVLEPLDMWESLARALERNPQPTD